MKNLVISLWIISSVLAGPALAADQLCFDYETCKRMLVEIEQGRIQNDISAVKSEINAIAEAQKQEYERIIKVKDSQLKECNRIQQEMNGYIQGQNEQCEQRIKAARPSLFEKIGQAVIFIGIGIGAGLLL